MGTKQIQVSGELWQEICTVGWRATLECTNGLLEGATFCGMSYKSHFFEDALFREAPHPESPHILVFIFEHPDWPEIEIGEDAPVLDITWEAIECPTT